MSPTEAFPKAWPWIGATIGLAGLLLWFLPEHKVLGIFILLATGVVVWFICWLNRPEFTLLSVEKVLDISDAAGKSAKLLRCMTARANHKGITEFWCRNISADGAIANIRIDNVEPAFIKTEAGDKQVCKRFDRPLKRGQKFDMVLSYELADSFPGTTEGLIHVVECQTKRLRLVVTLPDARNAKAARMSLRYGGQIHKDLPAPTITGRRIEFETKWTKLGAEYSLEWDW